MSVPTWSGDEHTLGTFRFRVLWFRVLLLAGVGASLAGAYGAGHSVGRQEQRPAAKRSPLSVEVTTAKLDAATPATDSGVLDWDDCIDFEDGPSKALTQAEERALLDEARARCERDLAQREAARAKDAPVLAKLESQTISLNFDQTPFNEALDFLRDLTRLNFVVSVDARDLIEEESVEVSLRLKDISLINAVKLILAAHEELTFRVKEGVIWIETTDAEPELTLEAYAVEDIVSGRLQGKGGASLDADALVELIETLHESDHGSLEYTSGEEGQKGTLLVRRSEAEQAQIRKLLSYLRTLELEATPSEPKWIAHYRAALAKRSVTLNFVETPLSDVVDFLQDITGLNLTIASGVDSDQIEVTIRLREVRLEDALAILLEQTDLSRSYVNETLLIHDPCDLSHARYTLEILDVRDLTTWLDADSLVELVLNGVGEDAWDDPASVEVHRGQLILRQTAAQREQVREVLAKLRYSRAQSATKTK